MVSKTMNLPAPENEVEIIEDPENPGNYLLQIPDDIAEKMGWKPGDIVDVGWDQTTKQLVLK